MDDAHTDRILVGYDGSPDADIALKWAEETALRTDRPLHVAIVAESGAHPGAAWWPAGYWSEVEDQARKLLAHTGVSHVEVSRLGGPVVPMMVALAHQASLLVVGSRGHGRVDEVFVGSVSQHLARHAPCPVAVVRARESDDAQRIVVGLDGSRASEAALSFACERARATGEVVSAIRAGEFGPVNLDRHGQMPHRLGTFLADQERQLAASVSDATTANPGVVIESDVVTLSPAEALVGASRHASLVVVGSRGLNAFAGMLLGSVSHEVLHRAHCPVVVIR